MNLTFAKRCFAVGMANDLKRQGNSHPINVDVFMRALSDALAGRHLLWVHGEGLGPGQKQDLRRAKTMISQRNQREGEAFFAANAQKKGVVTLPGGLQYKVLKKGDGKIPALDGVVLCNYRCTLLDGSEIDSSYQRKEPTVVPVKALIRGWTQALQTMRVGSKWQLFVPPQLAYGNQGFGPIPANATLVFAVELLSIQDNPQTVGQR